MTLDAWLTLAILVALFVMLIKTKLPAWIIFLGALTVALTLGLAPEEELLKGFSNSGVITVGAIHGGTKHNIISERVDLQMTVRSNDPETRRRVLEIIDEVVEIKFHVVKEHQRKRVVRRKTARCRCCGHRTTARLSGMSRKRARSARMRVSTSRL